MLAGTPVKPPQLDEFFCANEAHLRAAELAEIGLSERRSGRLAVPIAMLWACLRLPSLPLDVFARALAPADAARPFAVTTGGHYPRIVAANAAADTAAVVPGQLVSASLALAPDVVLRDRDPSLEAAALAARRGLGHAVHAGGIARAARRGAGRDRRQPAALRRALAARVGARARRARSRLRDAARARAHAARGARCSRATSERIRSTRRSLTRRHGERALLAALAPLPLAHLDAAPEIVATLAAAGVTTFGQACALPREALARRVGADFVATLDRARGLVPDPRLPFVPPPRYEGRLELPAPVADVEALAFAANRLVHELAGWLAGRGLGVLEMSLSLAHERYVGVKTGVPATAMRVALAAPTREPAHLIAVLRERLARVELPAAVEAVALASGRHGAARGPQPRPPARRRSRGDGAAHRPAARAPGRGRGDARHATRRASSRARERK